MTTTTMKLAGDILFLFFVISFSLSFVLELATQSLKQKISEERTKSDLESTTGALVASESAGRGMFFLFFLSVIFFRVVKKKKLICHFFDFDR